MNLKNDIKALVKKHDLEINSEDNVFDMVDYLLNCIEILNLQKK